MYYEVMSSMLWFLAFAGAFALVIVLEGKIVHKLSKIVKLLQAMQPKGEGK